MSLLWKVNLKFENDNHLDDLLKHRWPGPTSRVSDSVGLGWGPRIGFPSKIAGDANAVAPGTTDSGHGGPKLTCDYRKGS